MEDKELRERDRFELMIKKECFPDKSVISQLDALIDLMQKAHDMDKWVDANKEQPKFIDGKDYSENVFAIVAGELYVMCYCYIDGGDRDESGYAWCNCYGDIDGDCEFDDEYDVTHWQPLPTGPKQKD